MDDEERIKLVMNLTYWELHKGADSKYQADQVDTNDYSHCLRGPHYIEKGVHLFLVVRGMLCQVDKQGASSSLTHCSQQLLQEVDLQGKMNQIMALVLHYSSSVVGSTLCLCVESHKKC